eukprot:TRINITY_DN576_c4_g1_i5.p1 TRINITY_DN576_c4_g1~~TRINITY_DN576_c4_g1_i5.p1  ORF type:complete len:115 (-),score=32.68 TRINITY_DN576_c4_g1_i5:186-530(-)
MSDLRDTILTYKLNKKLSEYSVAPSEFVILKGIYGYLKHDEQTIDVTHILLDIVKQQGGNQLILNSGPKAGIFSNPAKKKKRALRILWQASDHQIHERIYQDNDPVHLNSSCLE